ncbi:MAG TPA: S41 family peptidase [Symbiobacteriaceae bacterium]|nr:S41 family peptidase [Symbiobacteriaceae bacterium]
MFQKRRKWIVAALSTVIFVGTTVGAAVAADPKDAMFQRIRSVYDVVEVWHKDGADLDKYTAGAIKGGLEALGDPYTNYFSEKDYADFLDSLNGSFSGIGAYLEQDGNYVVISSPIKGTPAAAAGLQSGDRILEANGTPLIGATTEKAVNLIRGVAGTSVTLKIERPAEKRTFTVVIQRAQISIPEVETKMLDAEVGYLQISTFGDDVVRSFYSGVESLKQQGARALVLDLRQNGGGYLNAAVDIASGFVPKGQPVVWEVGKSGKDALTSSGRGIDLPTVVLVDKGTASASEILAGALQDYGAAPLVGVTTFGKGTVQQILSMSGGGGIKVTVAEYLTAKERHVHHIGLTPDFVVEQPKPDSALTAPLELTRPLLPGVVGIDVLQLQNHLEFLGYAPDKNGYYEVKTVQAAVNFAAENGVNTDASPLISEQFVQVLNQKVVAHAKEQRQKDLQLDKALELARAKLKH